MATSVFRRGGQKRELFAQDQQEGGQGGHFTIAEADRQQLEEELQQILEVLTTPKAGKDWSAAIWRPEVGAAELVLERQAAAQGIGFRWRKRQWLHVEEAAFLVDRGDLMLFVEEDFEAATEQQQQQQQQQEYQQAGAVGVTLSAGRRQSRQQNGKPRHRRLLSQQETFELMDLAGIHMERYIVYSTLSRSGYLVMRYPSCWELDEHLTPAHVWALGAWQGCVGLHCPPPAAGAGKTPAYGPGSAGGPPAAGPTPGAAQSFGEHEGRQELWAVGGPELSTWQGHWVAVCKRLKALHQGTVPLERSRLEGEEDDADGPTSASPGPATTTCTAPLLGSSQVKEQHRHSLAAAAPTDRQQGAGAAAEPEAKRQRPRTVHHPGVAAVRHAAPALKDTVPAAPRQWYPRLELLPMLGGRAPAPTAAAPGGGPRPSAPSGAVNAPQGPEAPLGASSAPAHRPPATASNHAPGLDLPSHGVDLPVAEVLGQACPHLRPMPSVSAGALGLGPAPSQAAHLVYDVYKPGARAQVARAKRLFPIVTCHVALSSARPPSLAEQRAADQQAVSSLVPVKWAAVEGGILTLYELGAADVVRLL